MIKATDFNFAITCLGLMTLTSVILLLIVFVINKLVVLEKSHHKEIVTIVAEVLTTSLFRTAVPLLAFSVLRRVLYRG